MSPVLLLKNVRFRITNEKYSNDCIFILGVPRSGTTLLKTLLASHSMIGGSDYESTGIFGIRDIYSYAMGEVSEADMSKILSHSNNIIRFYESIVKILLKRTGKEIFVDKLQMRSYRLWYVVNHFPNARFIHIIRDGRDCYCSALKHPNVNQSDDIQSFARYWRKCVAMPARHIPPKRLYELRYEDLVLDPEQELTRVMEFLSIPFEPSQTSVERYAATTSIKKTLVHKNLSKPINTSSIGRWKNELNEQEKLIFYKSAGKVLENVNYLSF